MKSKEERRGLRGIAGLDQMVMSLAMVGLTVAMVLLVLSQILTSVTSVAGAESAAENATEDLITAIGGFPDWFPILVVLVVASVVFALFRGGILGGQQPGGRRR